MLTKISINGTITHQSTHCLSKARYDFYIEILTAV